MEAQIEALLAENKNLTSKIARIEREEKRWSELFKAVDQSYFAKIREKC